MDNWGAQRVCWPPFQIIGGGAGPLAPPPPMPMIQQLMEMKQKKKKQKNKKKNGTDRPDTEPFQSRHVVERSTEKVHHCWVCKYKVQSANYTANYVIGYTNGQIKRADTLFNSVFCY